MRAATILRPGQMRVEHLPPPDPAPGQVRVRIEGCGVCASNLGPWQGLPWLSYPLAPGEGGHEAWGRIDGVGAEVQGLRDGDRVAMLSNHAYAEWDVADAGQVVNLPPELDGQDFPGEAVACAMNIFRRSRIRAGEQIAVVGVGFLGAILVRLAARSGARVLAISRRPTALQLGLSMGACEAIALEDHAEVVARVQQLTHGRMCDGVIESVGAQWPLDLAAELARERGRLVIAGYHQDGPRQVNMQLWNWRGLDVINAHERDPQVYLRGMREAIDAVARGVIDLSALLTHQYPLEALDAALDACAERPEGFVKAVVHP